MLPRNETCSRQKPVGCRSTTGARLQPVETSQVSRGCWRRANEDRHLSKRASRRAGKCGDNKAASRKPRGLIVQFCLVGAKGLFAYCSGNPQLFLVWAAAWSARSVSLDLTFAEASALKPRQRSMEIGRAHV